MNQKAKPKDELTDLGRAITEPEPKRTEPPPAGVAGEGGDQGPSPKTSGAAVEGEAPAVDDVRALAEDMARGGWEIAFDEVTAELPFLAFDKETRDKAVARTTPVLVKHWDRMPDWFKKYQEEFALGFFVAGLMWGCYKQFNAHVAAAMRQAAQDAKNHDSDAPSGATVQ